MSKKFRVVVRGGGKNLYYIKAGNGVYKVFHHHVNFVWDDEFVVATMTSMDDALKAVESHAGERIDHYNEV